MKMKNLSLIASLILTYCTISAQNSSEKIIGSNTGLHIGGYGQIDYNRTINDESNILTLINTIDLSFNNIYVKNNANCLLNNS